MRVRGCLDVDVHMRIWHSCIVTTDVRSHNSHVYVCVEKALPMYRDMHVGVVVQVLKMEAGSSCTQCI